jgi:glycerol-3-phosphate acyltransferase PlsY
METAAAAIFCFVMGSIPFGLLFTKRKGIDLRTVGSGNIGATNVMRAAGKGAAILTLLGDMLKGAAAVALGKVMGAEPLYQGVLGLSAVAGHDFSLFLKFRGGKGVATSIGVLLLYAPKAGILTIALWLATIAITRISSMGAIVSFALMPLGVFMLGYPPKVLYIAVMISALLIIKHRGNIQRLLKGTEGRIGESA